MFPTLVLPIWNGIGSSPMARIHFCARLSGSSQQVVDRNLYAKKTMLASLLYGTDRASLVTCDSDPPELLQWPLNVVVRPAHHKIHTWVYEGFRTHGNGVRNDTGTFPPWVFSPLTLPFPHRLISLGPQEFCVQRLDRGRLTACCSLRRGSAASSLRRSY